MEGSDVITSLKEYAIAIRILRKYPKALKEFKTALGAASTQHPEEQNEIVHESYTCPTKAEAKRERKPGRPSMKRFNGFILGGIR